MSLQTTDDLDWLSGQSLVHSNQFFRMNSKYKASNRRHPREGNGTAWKIPWMEELGRLWSMGSLRVGHDWTTSLSLFTFTHWRRKWQPTPVFLPGESQGRGSLVGCRLWGHRVRHDWSGLAAAAGNILHCFLQVINRVHFQNPGHIKW